jgi:hypothetical protein
MKNTITKAIFLGLFMLSGASSYADYGLSAGVIGGLGMTLPSTGSSVTSWSLGGRVGYRFMPMLRLAAQWVYQPTTPSGVTYTSNFSSATASLDYMFTGMLDGLFVGPKLGAGFTSAASLIYTSFTFGAEVGYDYRLGSFSVGPQLDYLYVLSPTAGFPAYSIFDAMAAVKFWI